MFVAEARHIRFRGERSIDAIRRSAFAPQPQTANFGLAERGASSTPRGSQAFVCYFRYRHASGLRRQASGREISRAIEMLTNSLAQQDRSQLNPHMARACQQRMMFSVRRNSVMSVTIPRFRLQPRNASDLWLIALSTFCKGTRPALSFRLPPEAYFAIQGVIRHLARKIA